MNEFWSLMSTGLRTATVILLVGALCTGAGTALHAVVALHRSHDTTPKRLFGWLARLLPGVDLPDMVDLWGWGLLLMGALTLIAGSSLAFYDGI